MTLLFLALACSSAPVDSGDTDATDVSDTASPEDTVPDALSDEAQLGADTVRVTATDGPLRTYTLRSTAPLRDDLPAGGVRTFTEPADAPRLRSGRLLVDALFALAVVESREASVAEVRDGAFASGSGQACPCFETGEKWTWVWTRDTAYAADLGLAWLDPARSAASLRFKTSAMKSGLTGGPQIVQDTGTGGSWPVSTDRVVWALGAAATLEALPAAERPSFAADAREALRNTVEADRTWAFDPVRGLYRGETSFLDWREQTYEARTAQDTNGIARSFALSTNVGHFAALRVAADLAREAGDAASATRWEGWSNALKASIEAAFWDADAGLYRSWVGDDLDPAPVHRYDALGNALAALWLGDAARARTVSQSWPHLAGGLPVIWPQQPLQPIYHNRATWPFVTAYLARAAAKGGHAEAAALSAEALLAGAARNLSHMENLEATTGRPWVDDGVYSGPVVNSRRQLWSVAAMLSLVVDGWFGRDAADGALRFAPALPAQVREGWLAATPAVRIEGLPTPNGPLDLTLELPEGPTEPGLLRLAELRADDVVLANGAPIPPGTRAVVLRLEAPTEPGPAARRVNDASDFRTIFSPREPILGAPELQGADLRFALGAGGEAGVRFNVYRDGALVARDLDASSWTDVGGAVDATRCYALESVFPSTGHRSLHSAPQCWWGAGYQRITSLYPDDFEHEGGRVVDEHGRPHLGDWGEPDHRLRARFTAARTGTAWVQLVYGNGSGAVNTGITSGHKRVVVRAVEGGAVVGEAGLALPHLGRWDAWADSGLVRAELVAGRAYEVEVSHAPNMSALQAHAAYTAGLGGGPGVWNRVNVAEIKVLAR